MLEEMFYVGNGRVIYAKDVQRRLESRQIPPFQETAYFEDIHQLAYEQAAQKLGITSTAWSCRESENRSVRLCHRTGGASAGGIHEPITESHKRAELYQSIYQCRTMIEIEAIIMDFAGHAIRTLEHRFMDKMQGWCTRCARRSTRPITRPLRSTACPIRCICLPTTCVPSLKRKPA